MLENVSSHGTYKTFLFHW